MDLKSKGRTWVVNFYEKFEAMCEEVDDIVSQDAVKYVEGQVQTVGESVKRFCSDVMQDLLPPSSLEPRKHEAQVVTMKQNDTLGTYITTIIGTEEKPVCTNISHSSVEKKQIDAIKSGQEQLIHQPSADQIKEDNSDLSFVQKTDGLTKQKLDVAEENNNMEELIDDNMSNALFEECDCHEEPSWPEELDLASPPHEDQPKPSLLSESMNENLENGMHSEVSTATSTHHDPKDGRVCNSFLEPGCVSDACSNPLSPNMSFSAEFIEKKAAEVRLISSTSSLSAETYNISEVVDSNVSQNKENICSCPVNHINSIPDLSDVLSSSQQLPMLYCENKVADASLTSCSSVLSLGSNGDLDTSTTNDTASLAELSENRHEDCRECTRLEALLSSLDIDNSRTEIDDPGMESIELSDKVMLDGSHVVDSKLLSALSCRHRSYKKILKDAFTYKRRLRKEYEQLAIMYGDIDIEPSYQPHQNLLPCVHTSSLSLENSLSHDSCDHEWELL